MPSVLKTLAVAAAVLVGAASATDGGDVSQLYSTATYQCTKSKGWNFAIARSYCSYGAPDKNAPQNLANMKAAGIPYRDVYHFPCMGKVSAAKQVADNYNAIKGQGFGMMWFDVESNPSSGCGFSASASSNCAFLKELIAAGNSLGIKMGIYSSSYMWSSIMGSCTAGADHSLPLWYAHYDGSRTFSDFKAFGGWKKPAIKQYADHVGICSINADADWY